MFEPPDVTNHHENIHRVADVSGTESSSSHVSPVSHWSTTTTGSAIKVSQLIVHFLPIGNWVNMNWFI